MCDGHDLPRLIDEGVPGIAAVIDDIVEGFEDTVRLEHHKIHRVEIVELHGFYTANDSRRTGHRSDVLATTNRGGTRLGAVAR